MRLFATGIGVCAHAGWGAHSIRRLHGKLPQALIIAFSLASPPALADQGGTSFWLPGAFGSLAC